VRDAATEPASVAGFVGIAEVEAGEGDEVADGFDGEDFGVDLERAEESEEEKSEAKENGRDVDIVGVRGVAAAMECSGRVRETWLGRSDIVNLLRMISIVKSVIDERRLIGTSCASKDGIVRTGCYGYA